MPYGDSAHHYEPPAVPPLRKNWEPDSKAPHCQVCHDVYFGMVRPTKNIHLKLKVLHFFVKVTLFLSVNFYQQCMHVYTCVYQSRCSNENVIVIII